MDMHMDEVEGNTTILQAFEWYSHSGLWQRLQQQLPSFKAVGFDHIWLPPGCKASHAGTNGYDLYDLYDLGEFDWKGTRSTKWGSKEELVDLSRAAKEHGIGLIWDAVLGHKASADKVETCRAVEVDSKDRTREKGSWHDIDAWLAFDYTAPGDKYSSHRYSSKHFNGTDYDQRTGKCAIYKLREWAADVDHENGNYDYLLCANVDFSRQEVRDDAYRWAKWITTEVGLSGFRFDAVKHMSRGFTRELIDQLDTKLLLIGEYATPDSTVLSKYIEAMGHRMLLLDFVLLSNLVALSTTARPDLRTMFRGTLAMSKPKNCVTFVNSHDSQARGRPNEDVIAPWLVCMAYAWTLLSKYGGIPVVFWGDLYGVNGPDNPRAPTCPYLAKLVMARKLYAYGPQRDYLDHPFSVGFTRSGHGEPHSAHSAGLAVVMTWTPRSASKVMYVGQQHAGEQWTSILEEGQKPVIIDGSGFGKFKTPAKGVAVYTNMRASGIERIHMLPNI